METVTGTRNPTTYETSMLRYAQDTRDAAEKTASRTNFIAWVVGVFAALSLIGMIYSVAQFEHFVNVVTSPASTCATQGGVDPSC